MDKVRHKWLNANAIKGIIDDLIEAMPQETINKRYKDYTERVEIANIANKSMYEFYQELIYKAKQDKDKANDKKIVELGIKAKVYALRHNRPLKIGEYIKYSLRSEIALMLMDTKYQRFFYNLTKQQISFILNLNYKQLGQLENKGLIKFLDMAEEDVASLDKLRDGLEHLSSNSDYELDDNLKERLNYA